MSFAEGIAVTGGIKNLSEICTKHQWRSGGRPDKASAKPAVRYAKSSQF